MRIGLYYFLQAPPDLTESQIFRDEVDQMVLGERLGFDSVWLTEHHFSDYGLSAAPSVLAATVAARTERIRLGLAAYIIPFHHPLRLAEETATLDILSRGRLTVGIGRGNRPLEFVGHGVCQDDSRGLMEEGVEILTQAWTQDRVSFQGRHWQIDGIRVRPRPVTRPHPPLAFAVTSPQSIEWAAAHRYAIMSSGLFTPLPALVAGRERYQQALVRAGCSAAELQALLRRWVVTKHVYVAPTDEEARRDAEGPERWYLDSFIRSIRPDGIAGLSEAVSAEARAAAERMAGLRWEDLVEDALLVGSPETLRARLRALAEAGVGEVLCWMNFGGLRHDKAVRSMQLFAQEVMPFVRGSALPDPLAA